MRRILFLIVAIIPVIGYSQTITQKADGNNSILYKGSSVTLNTKDSEVTFGFSNLNNIYKDTQGFIVGGELKGKNDEGIAALWNKKNAAGQASGVINIGWHKSDFPEPKTNPDIIDSLKNLKELIVKEEFVNPVKAKIKVLFSDTTVLEESLLKKLEEDDIYLINENREIKNKEYKRKYNELIAFASERKVLIYKRLEKIENEYDEEYAKDGKVTDPDLFDSEIYYVSMGITGQSFKYFTEIDTTNYLASFTDTLFTGYNIGGGFNLKHGNITVGVSLNANYKSTFNQLSKKSFEITQESKNDIGQELTTKKEITAYTGKYEKFWTYEVNIDLLYSIPVSANHYCLINPYFNGVMGSSDTDIYPSHINFGLGLYAFKNDGNFLGGLYVHVKDPSNEFERLKENPQIEPIYNKLQVGLVLSYSFKEFKWR